MSKRVFAIAVIFVLVAGGVYFYVMNVVFPSPKNCNVCHFITPFYRSWETSTHNKVPCLKCHDYSSFLLLASIVGVRTVLSYFLRMELKQGTR